MGIPKHDTILLVAPNLSMVMGGEAYKALSICRQLVAEGYDVVQVAHERCRTEVERDYPGLDVRFVADGGVQRFLFRLIGPNWIVGALDVFGLRREARRVACERSVAIAHFTSPISPVYPHLPFPEAPVVIGPINGNIFYPPGFTASENRSAAVKRMVMPRLQRVLASLFRGKHGADAILVAGGDRTRRALAHAGVDPAKLIDTLDSGVADRLGGYAPVDHMGRNTSFVFFGRLVGYKACDLAIRALAAADQDLTLDIIGGGEAEGDLRALVSALGLGKRVTFVGWLNNGPALFDRLRSYRGFVYPSLAEANGIVLQEAMMLGVPIVALDWGGAAALLDGESAILVDPISPDHVIAALARAMNRLAGDPALANGLGRRARAVADDAGFVWPRLARAWVGVYNEVLRARGQPPLPMRSAGLEQLRPSADVGVR